METNKYKKYHKQNKLGRKEKDSLRGLKKGFYGLKVLESGIITPKQLETARRVIARITKRAGKIFINVFCNHPLTKKPLLSRMGKGAGGIDSWIAYVKRGEIIIEVKGVSKKLILMAFKAVQYRISIKMVIIEREVIDA
jgi:large subunit ribosomal protein L16